MVVLEKADERISADLSLGASQPPLSHHTMSWALRKQLTGLTASPSVWNPVIPELQALSMWMAFISTSSF